MATTINSYLFFSGRCEAALEFYKQAIGAHVEMIMRYNKSPTPIPEGQLQAGFEHKVMHASLLIEGNRIMVSDGCDDKSKMCGVRIVLNVDTREQARKYFDGLSVDGNVEMPLVETFWSPCFGMVTDKFDVGWMVMVPGQPS